MEEDKQAPNVLAERLMVLRKLNAWTLEDVASRSGLTKSYLSKLERGRSSPTIATMLKLARALNTSVDKLIGDGEQADEILHVPAGKRVPFSPSKERLGYNYEAIAVERADKSMQPFIMMPPFELRDEPQQMSSHAGEELIYLISGDMEVVFADRTVTMAAGDSLYFNAALAHRSRSLGSTPAQALVVVSDPGRIRSSAAGAQS